MKCILNLLSVLALPLIALSQGPNGLHFDGVNDYVQSNYNGISGTGARTVECWVKTTANCIPNQGGLQNTLVDWGSFVTGGRFTMNILWSNALRIEVGGSGLSGSTPINDGVWHHVAAVYDPSGGNNKYRLYVDGSLEAQGNLTTPMNTGTSTKVRIGRRIDGVNYFNGSVDEVRIWAYAKTSNQIAGLMDTEICYDAPGLMFYYNFNHGTAGGMNVGVNTVEDQANNYDGNLNGFSYTGTASNWVDGAPVSGSTFTEQSVTSCGAWSLVDGTAVTESGTYVEQLEAASGCDSVVTTTFTYAPVLGDTIVWQSCGAMVSPGGLELAASGIYTDALVTAEGCDSLVVVDFTLLPAPVTELSVTACGSFTDASGNVYTASGEVTEVHPSVGGCDSTVVIDLTVLPVATVGVVAQICEGESFLGPDGLDYSESGLYTFILEAANGCDSVVTLDLEVAAGGVELAETAAGWEVVSPPAGATFQWSTCAGELVDGATGAELTGVPSGEYACSVSVGNCTWVSDCVEVVTGLPGLQAPSLQVFPVPARDWVQLTWGPGTVALEVLNAQGQILERWPVPPTATTFRRALNLAPGAYFLTDGTVVRPLWVE